MPDSTPVPVQPAMLTRWIRLGLLATVGILIVVVAHHPKALLWWGLLVLAALPEILTPGRARTGHLGRAAEVLVCTLAASYYAPAAGVTMPYLVAPVLAAALFAGFAWGLGLVGLALLTLAAAGGHAGMLDDSGFTIAAAQWLVVACGAVLLGTWIRELSRPKPEPEFAQATRLLTQLRTIARQLPGTLDPGGIAERLLDELRASLPADRCAVFTASGGGRLEVIAERAPDRVAWQTSLDADTPISEAWASQQAQLASRSLTRDGPRSGISALVLPLVTGVRTVGLVIMEADLSQAYPMAKIATVTGLARTAALRLETALLFDEVRSLATTEERQRLAREIHDGVAQELVMVGYGIDNAVAGLESDSEVAEQLRTLRAEVTRVITELRLSLFELRSDVDRHGGLGSAIAEYARAVGTSAGLRVHLSLDETTARLPAAVESELLRIAQEAITNARKHSGAANLWVSCEVDPPFANVEVSDDGAGIPTDAGREGSYGLSIMSERAERIRASFAIQPRAPRGTTVTVTLGPSSATRHGSVSTEQEVASGNDSHDADQPA